MKNTMQIYDIFLILQTFSIKKYIVITLVKHFAGPFKFSLQYNCF